ncbi:MAG TPA: transglycosylase SLT domain-containing protein [Ktedonobacteraceae bacterium]|nr:transglycosylase SLT domain-containing protein [Ktedonobacteraceae bacterium]
MIEKPEEENIPAYPTVSPRESDFKGPTPITTIRWDEGDHKGSTPTTAPLPPLLNLFPGQVAETGTRTTEDLKPVSDTAPSTGPISLTSALKATMPADKAAQKRIVIIPGTMKSRVSNATDAPAKRKNSRLRNGIILAVMGVILVTTLLSLTPLASGQGATPPLIRFGIWVQSQVANWQIISHDNTPPVAQDNPPQIQAPPQMQLPKSQYIAIAQQDAINAGISPDYFVRQINQESGFNPNAYSPSGAEGIAQFMPATARGLGIDPWDPIQALRAAANVMAGYDHRYGGNYAMALAAYNAGSGTVQWAVQNCGSNWMSCLPAQTQNYIYVIMGI